MNQHQNLDNRLKDLIEDSIDSISARDYAFMSAEYTNSSDEVTPVFKNIATKLNDSNIVVVYGDNASGKSLVTKLFSIEASKKNIPCRAVSMKNRTSSGIERSLIFGSERTDSTGATSARTTNLSLNSAIQDKCESFVILDEPDIGLSSRYSKAMGELIANKAKELAICGGYVLLVTHSKELLYSVISHAGCPSYIGMDTHLTLSEWLESNDVASIDELLELKSIGSQKKRALSSYLKN